MQPHCFKTRLIRRFLHLSAIAGLTLVLSVKWGAKHDQFTCAAVTGPAIHKRITGEFPQLANETKRIVRSVSCASIISGEEIEIEAAKKYMDTNKRQATSDDAVWHMTKDCERFKRLFIPSYPLSDEEINFPIAYSILLYEDVFEVSRLLSAIYRAHNVYCLHVDRYSSVKTQAAVMGVASCLQNVFVATKLEFVVYAGFSRLQADLNCMDDLLGHNVSWRYFINLASRMFPLKTNAEIVKILSIYNGANDIVGTTQAKRMVMARVQTKHLYVENPRSKRPVIVNTKNKTDPLPHGMKLLKGSAYGVFTREFVKFVLHDRNAKDLLEWCKQIKSPDEYYWATLNYNSHLHPPGGYSGKPDNNPWLATFALWNGDDIKCKGKYVRGVCVFGVGDIQRLIPRKELFANKFYMDFQYLGLDCLEEWLRNKTFSPPPFNSSYYKRDQDIFP